MADNPYAAPQAEVAQIASEAPPLWNPNACGNWSLLFTPVFGSFLVWKNWQAVDQPRGLAWFVVSVLMLLPTVIVPGVGLLYLIVWYFASVKPQARFVRERYGNDYPRRGWGKPLLVGFGAYAVLIAGLVLLASGAS